MDIIKSYESLTPLIEGCSKSQIKETALKQAAIIIDAGTSELAFAMLTKAEHLIKETKNAIKQDALIEVSRGNDFAFGVKLIESKSTRYDYTDTQDMELLDLEHQLAELNQKIKDRQGFLKGIKGYEDIISEYGEVTRIFPAVKISVDTIRAIF